MYIYILQQSKSDKTINVLDIQLICEPNFN